MKLRVAIKIIFSDFELLRYKDSTLYKANKRYSKSATAKVENATWNRYARAYRFRKFERRLNYSLSVLERRM
jgi:hypothetical protein